MPFDRLDKEQARAEVARLVDRFRDGQADYTDPSYPESQLRLDFLDPLLVALGWDLTNAAGLPHSARDAVVEQTVEVSEAGTGRPDYLLRVDAVPRIVVEAKKPSVAINAPAPAIQARTYAWSLDLPVGVLTNFAELAIYDGRHSPVETDDAEHSLYPGCRFGFEDFVGRFDELWDQLSFETAFTPRYEEVYEYEEPPRGESDFDRAFLSQLRGWRLVLASDIAERNPTLPAPEVAARTQSLLNALVFLRVCEDRRIESYRELLEGAETDLLVQRFRDADDRYNAGLFAVLEDTTVGTEALLNVASALYWPNSKYAFGLLRPGVLAAIYEQFLGESIEIDGTRSVAIVPKPEVTHAGGVVPTPRWVVERLVDGAISGFARQGGDLTAVRVLDMAAGSGVFLVEVLEQLVRHHEETTGTVADLGVRAAIALNHLFGVDIDREAVEAARLDVLLAVLGDASVAEVSGGSVLPDLSANIVVGNSVVDADFDARFPAWAGDPAIRARIKPFSWQHAFPGLVEPDGLFDLIVGNPPYQRIQTLARFFPEQLAYLQDEASGLVTGQSGSFDVYMVFVEQALALLRAGGFLAFVVPNRFLHSAAGLPLRSLLSGRVEALTDFGSRLVFPHRSAYVCLLYAGDGVADPLEIEQVENLDAWRETGAANVASIARDELGDPPWPTAADDLAPIFHEMRQASGKTLADVAEVYVGVQTSGNALFLISPTDQTDDAVRFTVKGVEWEIERGITRPALNKRRLVQYDMDPEPDALAIFPYDLDGAGADTTATLLSRAALEDRYPQALSYFEAHEEALRNRDVNPDPGQSFWAYGRNQSLTKMNGPKIVVRTLTLDPLYAIDNRDLVVLGGGSGPYYLIRPRVAWEHSWQTLIAILSHPYVDSMVAAVAREFRGGYFVHAKQFLVDLPIPPVDDESDARLTELVAEAQMISVRLRTEPDRDVAASLAARKAYLKAEIEDCVGHLYGLGNAPE